MVFHLPSFLLGVVTGAVGRNIWERLRPVVTKVSAAGADLGESLLTRVGIWQEDAEDAIAAAKRPPRQQRPVSRVHRTRAARPAHARR